MFKSIAIVMLASSIASADEVGYASWYGLENKVSSTGKTIQHNTPAIAHKTLPIGTLVKITHLRTQKTINAVVEDRGPYKKHRIVDLNIAAAKKLGIVNEGIALVAISKTKWH